MTTSQEAREYPPLTDDQIDHIMQQHLGTAGGSTLDHWRKAARAVIDADRKARQQDALDARRYRTMLANLHTLVLVTDKGSTLDLRAPQRGEQHSRKGTDVVLDGLSDAAIAKGDRHE